MSDPVIPNFPVDRLYNSFEEEKEKALWLQNRCKDCFANDNLKGIDNASRDDYNRLMGDYETFYGELKDFIATATDNLENDEDEFENDYTNYGIVNELKAINNTRRKNVNVIVGCMNRVCVRIGELTTNIYKIDIEAVRNMKMERHEIIEPQHNLIPNQKAKRLSTMIKQPEVNEMDDVFNNKQLITNWCNKNNYKVIFDSRNDGDGSNNHLVKKVINKKNLCFISSDDKGNVFGGYVSAFINATGRWINDGGVFVFSLRRNYVDNPKKYGIGDHLKNEEEFLLCGNDKHHGLYRFGNDIYVKQVGFNNSLDDEKYHYDYQNEKKLLVDDNYPAIKRIIVLQMS